MNSRARKTAAFAIPLVLVWAIWMLVSPAGQANEPQAAAHPQPAKRVEMPVAELPTGGPYVDAESVRESGLAEAAGRGVIEPRAESVRFMTYGEAVEWYGTGRTPEVDPFREVYVVSVPGRITVGHHTRVSYARSYYIYDASTGRLVQFGATDHPDPVAMRRALPR